LAPLAVCITQRAIYPPVLNTTKFFSQAEAVRSMTAKCRQQAGLHSTRPLWTARSCWRITGRGAEAKRLLIVHRKQLDALGEPYHPYRTVVAWLCWQAAQKYGGAAATEVTA
jgi:3-methyladenine DNA glycosylase/8-oxoguanine DNA glycosylase